MQGIEELLQPISQLQQCGVDLAFAPEVDAILEARKHDDASIEQGDWVADLKNADWTFVIERCSTLISSKSKDLRLAVWFAEANAKIKQFSGLAEGYRLVGGLCDRYWVDLHPLPDDDGYEQRVGNLQWLLSRSVQLIKEMRITAANEAVFRIVDYETASTSGLKKSQDDFNLTLAGFESARRNTPAEFYKKLLADALDCRLAFAEFENSVNVKLGIDGPAFSAAKEAISRAVDLISRISGELGIVKTAEPAEKPTDISSSNRENRVFGVSQTINSRAQALAQLREIAEFFKLTEPHSPVAYLAEKAANWGEMPLHLWLGSVVKDPAALSHIEELLGLDLKHEGQ